MKYLLGLALIAVWVTGQLVGPSPALASSGAAPASSCGSSYVVQTGDTLSAIAARCGVSLRALMSANRLGSAIIRRGQRLVIPATGLAAIKTPAPARTTGGRAAATPNTYQSRLGAGALSNSASTPIPWGGSGLLSTRSGINALAAAPPVVRASPTPRIVPTIRP